MKKQPLGVVPLDKAMKEFIEHRLDVITDSDWFDELVEQKIEEHLKKRKLNHE